MIKKLLFSLAFPLLISLNLNAQAPEAFKYQAIVRDISGNLLANSNIGVKFSVVHQTPTGEAVYTETFSPTTNEHGLINLEIGKGTAMVGDFSTIDWSSGPYFIEIFMDKSGGTNYMSLGVNPLLSVPYALYAKSAGNAFSGDYNDLENKPDHSNYITSPDDADADPENEKIESVQLNGNVLEITEGGRTFSLNLAPLIQAAHTTGYNEGQSAGYELGYNDGLAEDGYTEGYNDGKVDGFDQGIVTGYDNGYNDGHMDGHIIGYDEGYNDGWDDGYDFAQGN